jgi:heme O synthase-like polyprenyltransferase
VKAKLRACLELVRIPNIFTAIADVIAGFLFVGSAIRDWPALLLLALASACLYGGGVALNDVCDWARDAQTRPSRPIPSGRITRRQAATISIGLLAAGILIAAFVNLRATAVAATLVAAIVLYDAILKETAPAPTIMGLCRALNLALGMSAMPMAWTHATAMPLALMWLYVTSITLFAQREALPADRPPDQRSGHSPPQPGRAAGFSPRGHDPVEYAGMVGASTSPTEGRRYGSGRLPWRPGIASPHRMLRSEPVLTVGTVGVCLAVAGQLSYLCLVPAVHASYLVCTIPLLMWLGFRGFSSAFDPQPQKTQSSVKTFVISIILLDTATAWAARGPTAALIVLAMLAPTLSLGWRFRVT